MTSVRQTQEPVTGCFDLVRRQASGEIRGAKIMKMCGLTRVHHMKLQRMFAGLAMGLAVTLAHAAPPEGKDAAAFSRADVVRRKPRGGRARRQELARYPQDDGLVWNDIAAIKKLTALVASARDWPLENIVAILRENPGENVARGERSLIDGGRPRRSPQAHRSCSDENK